jgi:hypothetical protein
VHAQVGVDARQNQAGGKRRGEKVDDRPVHAGPTFRSWP